VAIIGLFSAGWGGGGKGGKEGANKQNGTRKFLKRKLNPRSSKYARNGFKRENESGYFQ